MLKSFVTLLLIAGGVTASDICDEYSCEIYDTPVEFPETKEELLNACKPGIDYLECRIRYDEICIDVPWMKPMGSGVLTAAIEVCSENTTLHAAVVDNLKCFKDLQDTYRPVCVRHEASDERIQHYVEALGKEGVTSLTENENNTREIHECIHMMDFFACHILVIEKKCGDVAMNAAVEILQKAGPAVLTSCEDSYNFLPTVIRLRRVEKENKDSSSGDGENT